MRAKWTELKNKFNPGNIVKMKKDDFHFNPAFKVTSIGMVQAVHVYAGKDVCIRIGRGETKPRSFKGRISYTISGFSLRPEECQLELYEEVVKAEEEENETAESEINTGNSVSPLCIKVGDRVSVNINAAKITLAYHAEVLRMPCATGDSWIFKALTDNSIFYVSEGCTVSLLEKGEERC